VAQFAEYKVFTMAPVQNLVSCLPRQHFEALLLTRRLSNSINHASL